MIRTKLSTLALASVLVLPLATAGCSKGSSPTEPAFDEELASASALSSVTGESKGRGKGGDGKNADDNDNNRRRRGRGGNDDKADDNGGNRRRGRGDKGDKADKGDKNDDGGNRPARNGHEFEGAVASVGSDSVTLAGGLRIAVDGGTRWSGRGDLFSLSQIAGSLAAGNDPRVEGRGTRRGDGSLLASTIKAEHVGD